MKKLILSAAAIVLFTAIGCNGSGGGDPKGVLMSFIDALGKKDIATAKKYATKDSESMMQMMEMGMKMAPDKDKKDEKYDKDNMEFGDAKIDGDKATVPVKDKKSGETTNFTLKKEGGSWKVAFDKATMMQMGQDKAKEHGMDMNKMMDSSASKLNEMENQLDTTNHMMNADTSH